MRRKFIFAGLLQRRKTIYFNHGVSHEANIGITGKSLSYKSYCNWETSLFLNNALRNALLPLFDLGSKFIL